MRGSTSSNGSSGRSDDPMNSPYADPAVVATYDRLAAPAQFAAPAKDLAALLGVPPGATVLDLGTGTGLIARELADIVGPNGRVVGVDASIEMLRAGRARGRHAVAVARLPGLPFGGRVFDAVAAGFVITHVASYKDALHDLVRVCGAGGRVGLTAWGTLPNPAGALWREVASRFAAADRLAAAFRAVIPWDEWFSQPGRLEDALRAAQFAEVTTVRREYVVRTTTEEFLSIKAASVEGTLLRRLLSAQQWNDCARDAAGAFRSRFGDRVEYVRDVWFAVGSTRPR